MVPLKMDSRGIQGCCFQPTSNRRSMMKTIGRALLSSTHTGDQVTRLKRFIWTSVLIAAAGSFSHLKADCDQCPKGSTVTCSVSGGYVYCTNKDGITIKTPQKPQQT
jgi:hypothetical protein